MLHSTVAVLAAISTGADISAAATTGFAAPNLPGATQTSPYQWSVQNLTDQALTNGQWTVSEAGGASSTIDFGATRADPYGGTVTATQEYGGKALNWNASFCYRGKRWSSEPSKVNTKAPATFTLMTDSQDRLVVKSPGGEYSPLQDDPRIPC